MARYGLDEVQVCTVCMVSQFCSPSALPCMSIPVHTVSPACWFAVLRTELCKLVCLAVTYCAFLNTKRLLLAALIARLLMA